MKRDTYEGMTKVELHAEMVRNRFLLAVWHARNGTVENMRRELQIGLGIWAHAVPPSRQ